MAKVLESESRASFTFHVACEEIDRVSSQLSDLTSQAKTVSDAINSTQSSIDRKRKELRALIRKVGSKKKALEKLKKRIEQEPVKFNKEVATVECDEEVNTTFATEDLSITEASFAESPSARKRKRFAGIWDNVDVDMEVNEERGDKRARVVVHETTKENVDPHPEIQRATVSSFL